MDLSNPYNILGVTDRSINCHVTQSVMHYLVILYRKSIGFFVYAWSLKKWISVTTVSENIMVDWTCYTLLFVVGVFFFFFFLFFFFWFCFLVFFDRWFFWGVHFCFDFWGGLYCFNFLFLHCVGFFFVFFLFLLLLLFFVFFWEGVALSVFML